MKKEKALTSSYLRKLAIDIKNRLFANGENSGTILTLEISEKKISFIYDNSEMPKKIIAKFPLWPKSREGK